jgi:hypothetical protein
MRWKHLGIVVLHPLMINSLTRAINEIRIVSHHFNRIGSHYLACHRAACLE